MFCVDIDIGPRVSLYSVVFWSSSYLLIRLFVFSIGLQNCNTRKSI